MKYASAMKYGGELVAAVDCDYNSFKELVPLCPNCKEPVYLRIGGQRESAKGKAYQIGPHWCHFKGTSKEQVAGCELRVNGYTEKDRAKIAAQARGQRLKLLQRWGLSVLDASPAFSLEDSRQIIIEIEKHNRSANVLDHITCEIRKGKSDFASVFFKMTPSVFWENARKKVPGYFKKSPDFDEEMQRFTQTLEAGDRISLMTEKQRRLHFLYASEFFWMICSDMQSPLLRLLVASNMYARVKAQTRVTDIEMYVVEVFLHIYAVLSTIPWASEFQRLEAEAKQRKDAA